MQVKNDEILNRMNSRFSKQLSPNDMSLMKVQAFSTNEPVHETPALSLKQKNKVKVLENQQKAN